MTGIETALLISAGIGLASTAVQVMSIRQEGKANDALYQAQVAEAEAQRKMEAEAAAQRAAEDRAAAAATRYNANVETSNAAVSEQNRRIVLQQTAADVEDVQRDSRRRLASIRAAYGASGFAFTGSPIDVLQDTALEDALEARRVDYEGRLSARQELLDAAGFTDRATLDRYEAGNLEARASTRKARRVPDPIRPNNATGLRTAGAILGGAGRAVATLSG